MKKKRKLTPILKDENGWYYVCVHCLIKYGRVRNKGKVYCNTCARKLFPEVQK